MHEDIGIAWYQFVQRMQAVICDYGHYYMAALRDQILHAKQTCQSMADLAQFRALNTDEQESLMQAKHFLMLNDHR